MRRGVRRPGYRQAVRLAVAASLAALVGTAALPGAARDGDPAEEATARLRILNASPGGPSMDVHVGGERVLRDVVFGEVSPYLDVPAGAEVRITLMERGAEPAGGAAIDEVLTLEPGSSSTLAAVGPVGSVEARVIADTPEPAPDTTQLRVVHLSPDTPAIEVAFDGGDVLVSDLAYAGATGYPRLPPARYDLEIRLADSHAVAFDIEPLVLESATSTSAFAIGSLADGSFEVVTAIDASLAPEVPTAGLRILQASPDAPTADVWLDGQAIVDGLAFGDITEYLEVPAGERRVQLFATGTDPASDAPILDVPLTLEPDTLTTLAAAGEPASLEARVLPGVPGPSPEASPVPSPGSAPARSPVPSPEPSPGASTAPSPDEAEIRIVDLVTDGPALDIARDGRRGALARELRYPAATDYLAVPAGELDLEIRRAGRDRLILDPGPLEVEAGRRYTLFLIGSPARGSFRTLLVDDAAAEPGP